MFVHSLPGARLVPPFAEEVLEEIGVRLLVPERPGFGFSEFTPGRTITDAAHDVLAVADFLDLSTFRVFGVSSGCAYVLACCVEFPDRIDGAGIASGITEADEAGILHDAIPAPLHFLARRSRLVSHVLHSLLVLGMKKAPERAIQALGETLSPADRKVLERPVGAQYVIDISLESARYGVRGWVYDDWLLNRPWGFAYDGISPQVPIKLWWGGADQTAPIEHGRVLARQIPHATFREYEECGHFGLMFDYVGALLAELCDTPAPRRSVQEHAS
jgi:pimeloyl-ACP methyl ester carboxylesterase